MFIQAESSVQKECNPSPPGYKAFGLGETTLLQLLQTIREQIVAGTRK